jgi:hypothetical protein
VDDADNVFDADLGFHKVAVSTERFTALALLLRAESGHHDYFDVFGF